MYGVEPNHVSIVEVTSKRQILRFLHKYTELDLTEGTDGSRLIYVILTACCETRNRDSDCPDYFEF